MDKILYWLIRTLRVGKSGIGVSEVACPMIE